jgi:basic amino acid/polyamine antiporter, APA family
MTCSPGPLGWTDCEGSARFGIVMAALLPSLLLLLRRCTSNSGLTIYTDLVDLDAVDVAKP